MINLFSEFISMRATSWQKPCVHNKKKADQHGRPRSLVSSFIIRFLESTILKMHITNNILTGQMFTWSNISKFYVFFSWDG